MGRDKTEKEGGRKERVLHTRVPPVLEKELRKLADNLRVPVSNVVRAILEDAVAVADFAGRKTEAELRSWVQRFHSERDLIHQRIGCCPPANGTAPDETAGEAGEGGSGSAAAPGPEAPAPTAPAGPEDGLLGFQPMVLATATKCGRCDRDLVVGEEAFLGIRETPGPRLIVGRECIPRPSVEKEESR